jgi:hypothetical protein
MKHSVLRIGFHAALVLGVAHAVTACAVAPRDDASGATEQVSTQSEAIGEATCATVDDTMCGSFGKYHFCFHTACDGPSTDGAAVAYVADSLMTASSPDASYTNGTACQNAFITDIYGVNDAADTQRFVIAQPVTLPTNPSACAALIQGTSVYFHETGAPSGTWQQLGGAGTVFHAAGTWAAGPFGAPPSCQINNGIPTLPNTGIDEIRVATYSFGLFFPVPTQAGVDEVDGD